MHIISIKLGNSLIPIILKWRNCILNIEHCVQVDSLIVCFLWQDAGRLLYVGQDDWVHVNCALWSAEVYEEEHDGTLQNVQTALSRGRVMVSVDYMQSIVFTFWKLSLFIDTLTLSTVCCNWFYSALWLLPAGWSYSRLLYQRLSCQLPLHVCPTRTLPFSGRQKSLLSPTQREGRWRGMYTWVQFHYKLMETVLKVTPPSCDVVGLCKIFN